MLVLVCISVTSLFPCFSLKVLESWLTVAHSLASVQVARQSALFSYSKAAVQVRKAVVVQTTSPYHE